MLKPNVLDKLRAPKALLVVILLALLLGGVAGTTSCNRMTLQDLVITGYAVTLLLVVGVVMVVSEADAPADGVTPNYDCLVINHAGLPMLMFDGGRELGLVEPHASKQYHLGTGEHQLNWFPVEDGMKQLSFSSPLTIDEGPGYYQITIDPVY